MPSKFSIREKKMIFKCYSTIKSENPEFSKTQSSEKVSILTGVSSRSVRKNMWDYTDFKAHLCQVLEKVGNKKC